MIAAPTFPAHLSVSRLAMAALMLLTLNACALIAIGAAVVTASAVHDRRSVDVVVDDRLLNIAVRDALYGNDAFGNESRIKISAFNGWVLLAGEAVSEDQVEKATQLVSQVGGLKKLFNELAALPHASLTQASRDGVLSLQAKAAVADIKDLPRFDASRVKITTARGNVYLQGLVTEAEGARVVEQVRYVSGVEQVVVLFEWMEPTG
ncbi:MAG TPA: BON domain-containing protein [Wenzhouxiangella sp.]